MNGKDNLQRRVISIKSGDDDLGWHPFKPNGSYRKSLRKDVYKGWGDLFPDFSVGELRLELVCPSHFGIMVGVMVFPCQSFSLLLMFFR